MKQVPAPSRVHNRGDDSISLYTTLIDKGPNVPLVIDGHRIVCSLTTIEGARQIDTSPRDRIHERLIATCEYRFSLPQVLESATWKAAGSLPRNYEEPVAEDLRSESRVTERCFEKTQIITFPDHQVPGQLNTACNS